MSLDPIESAVKGAIEGALEWSDEKLKEYSKSIREKDLAFVEDIEITNAAIRQKKTSEYAILKKNINDERIRVLFQIGLVLRKIELNNKKVRAVKEKIVRKYGIDGLHIVEFSQNGVFTKYIAFFLEKSLGPDQMKNQIRKLFFDIELTNSFVQSDDNVEKEAEKVVVRILSNSPDSYVISGLRRARGKCKMIYQKAFMRISGYSADISENDFRIIIFLTRKGTVLI